MSAVRLYLTDLAEGLRARPSRTLGAAAGLAIGWMCACLSLAIGSEVRAAARRLEREFGLNTAALRLERAADIDRSLLDEFRAAAPDAQWTGLAMLTADSRGGAAAQPTIVLADEDLFDLGVGALREGRSWDAADVAACLPMAVITEAAAVTLGWRPAESRPLRDGRVWTAVGVVATDGGPAAALLPPAAVIVPWTSWAEAVESRHLDGAIVRAADEPSLARAIERVSRLLEEPGRAGRAHQWVTADLVRRRIGRWQRTAAAGTAALGALALLLGGVALASRLAGELKHRTPEIGLRRALGATRAQIAALLIGEAVAVNLAAAIGGWLLALAAVAIANATGRAVPSPGPFIAAVVLGVSVPMSALFAWLPARRAARLAPAEALRDE